MKRSPRFKPPKVTNPPKLVEVQWIDAQYDTEHDGPAADAPGLAILPAVGYHTSTNLKGPHGPYIVLSKEWSVNAQGQLCSRFGCAIPIGWIKQWSEVRDMEQIFPPMGKIIIGTILPVDGSPADTPMSVES